jgi:hypothetical protein
MGVGEVGSVNSSQEMWDSVVRPVDQEGQYTRTMFQFGYPESHVISTWDPLDSLASNPACITWIHHLLFGTSMQPEAVQICRDHLWFVNTIPNTFSVDGHLPTL